MTDAAAAISGAVRVPGELQAAATPEQCLGRASLTSDLPRDFSTGTFTACFCK